MDEFGFIADYLAGLAGPEALNLKDDAAIWSPKPGQDAIISLDTIIEGVHFPKGKFDAQLAQKLIRVNMSDLIAKGAKPLGYFMSLSLPKTIGQGALKAFCSGLKNDQAHYGIKLWGGDTARCSGPYTLSATFIGSVPKGTARLRSAAKRGDLICVTGQIGDAYLGLKTVLKQQNMSVYESDDWEKIYHVPNPPFEAAHLIRKFANASMDISDGLVADLTHLANASELGAQIIFGNIPISKETKKWVKGQPSQTQAMIKLATGGDDYQTLMSVSPEHITTFTRQAKSIGIDITVIGKMNVGAGVVCLNNHGEEIGFSKAGYTHF